MYVYCTCIGVKLKLVFSSNISTMAINPFIFDLSNLCEKQKKTHKKLPGSNRFIYINSKAENYCGLSIELLNCAIYTMGFIVGFILIQAGSDIGSINVIKWIVTLTFTTQQYKLHMTLHLSIAHVYYNWFTLKQLFVCVYICI